MGLDQYIFREIENEYEEDGRSKVEEIHYWRKNHGLNDWACEHFCSEDIFDFNCERIPLYGFMIDKLLYHIINNLDQANREEDDCYGLISEGVLEAFKDCRKRIDKGEILYYYAWW